ncbi:MAG: hypothetical protein KJZ65_15155 [Phycisphaerales bacterium]|nr:hypothetical protein [Phycisphaerales bacterium]
MTTVPKTFLGRLEFFERRLPAWSADPAAIGLTAGEVAQLAARVSTARQRYVELEAIRSAAEAATLAHKLANDAMYEFGSDLVQTIRAFADRSDNMGVYAAALIPPPKDPSPSGPPPQPTDVRFELLPSGGLRLRWKGSVARRAYFCIYRRIPGQRDFTLLDSITSKNYVDTTIPPGTTELTYSIQARRDQHSVGTPPMIVTFGRGGTTAAARRAA